jgi:NACHT domain./Calcineurin-like phosphoesterase.
MRITILHLSDLHYSQSCSRDLKIIYKALCTDLSKLSTQFGLKPDLIFFTGDFISKGEKAKEELDIASRMFLTPLLDHLNLQTKHLFIVPGNHEVDRSKISKVFEEGLHKNIYDTDTFNKYYKDLDKAPEDFKIIKRKLQPFLSFKNKFSSPSTLVTSTFFYDTHIIDISTLKIGIMCLNSAWRSSQFGEDAKRLLIGETVFLEGIDDICDCDLKFALSHHSLDMLTEWDQKTTKLSMAKNIDMLFTGHSHDSDFSYIQPILGSLYVSTCASIFSGRVRNGYSIIQIDCVSQTLSVHLRKWYDTRKEFDQETDKCEKGLLTYSNFKCNNDETNKLIEINYLKNNYQVHSKLPSIILPFDTITEVRLKDVFVAPMISDKSSFDKEVQDRSYFDLSKILQKKDNIIFFSRKEYGKTMLLRHVQAEMFRDDTCFFNVIPVPIAFSQLPKNNYKSITNVIKRELDYTLSDEKIEIYLKDGNFVFLVDDFDDYTDDDRDKKKNIFYSICDAFPKCRYIISVNEKISEAFMQESLNISSKISALKYYLCSFKTAQIRDLLLKWSAYHSFDVDIMLNQIIFYFQQLQIPVTPMAVTLFIGVLIRDRASKNIKNEAYLVENYLESILEKLDPSDAKSEMDFRDKESFLSHIADRMRITGNYEWTRAEFEKEKISYYEGFGEEIPSHKIFDDFFRKPIL